LYYIGLKLEEDPEISLSNIHVDQWEPYKEQKKISPLRAIENILNYLSRIKQDFLHASTQIIIVPGYEYKIVKKLITNFHQPQSTLLLLVSAFVGDDWKRIYDFALKNDFRFLSYGDSSLLIPKNA
ncbi:MAG: S-adenosylmethionine:tRNA ribosyltransferase-isomerase, partial [Prevotella sp.]|nr:S-adenosylmethionine:tRNA ribosyltransferase-isomerase [Prevotella sp.]